MSVKTNGVEFKKFINDDVFWNEDKSYDDVYISVDGVELDESDDALNAADSSLIKIEGGVVFDKKMECIDSVEGFFKKWKKQQSTVSFVVECNKDKLEALKKLIKENGGKAK